MRAPRILGRDTMTATVISFAGRSANTNRRPMATARHSADRENIVSIAAWLGRPRPKRTPTGVFFTSDVLVTPGQFA